MNALTNRSSERAAIDGYAEESRRLLDMARQRLSRCERGEVREGAALTIAEIVEAMTRIDALIQARRARLIQAEVPASTVSPGRERRRWWPIMALGRAWRVLPS
ncbi:hypothetical protein M446_5606 [Methylobacterium sp. 4-46]|uniref:hypothetical protein n=1 Tax=unclassified Methylobacterium TaxID=2615210 RepID=UPI000152D340|nr:MULTISPECIES: hypothetical protein [Methylobacterium]ACA19906.1 hypothetical protein M446_5606 [Methylobacterium sp. 4-46]WFT79093.1 hypothetical protein QA634_28275 [Methylobacterium nodulans]